MVESSFKITLASLEKLFGHQLDDTVYRMYWSMLGQIPDHIFHQVIQKVVSTFIPSAQVPFPVIAHFLKIRDDIYTRPIASTYKPPIVDKSELMSPEEVTVFCNSVVDRIKKV